MLLNVTHSPPEHGWLPVTFMTEEATVEVDASDALNNPLQDLVTALDAVSSGSASSVRWFLEPGAFVLDLVPSGQEVEFRLTQCRDSLEGSDGVQALRVCGSRSAILAPLCQLLRRVEAGRYPASVWPTTDLSLLESVERRLGLAI